MTSPATEYAQTVPSRSIMMIAWRSECYRSTTTADLFGADLHLIWPKIGNGQIGRALRYVVSFWKTFRLVLTHSPDFAIVMNLPTFAPMAAQLAAFFTGTNIILDFHSGGITSGFWSKFKPFFRFVASRAPFVICHNYIDGAVIESWGGTPFYLTALPSNFKGMEYQPAPADPAVLVICSFKSDEPVDVLLDAMQQCPEVQFQVTGNYREARLEPAKMPANVVLLGFIAYDEYIRRMAASTAIITVSDRGHIMQAAVHEALSLGVPVITNNSPTIEGVLGDAGVYAAVEPASLAQAIMKAVASSSLLRARMIVRKNTLRLELVRQMKQALTM
jgi:glycosyltransferase involved in cell wall biosynthesis